ncbi:MAG: PqqD family peptide modification chaperone [Aigarchaeota archaeon]|nr:PqqD family peptide modification chaperone [Aigarchaeota archaeon]MCX8192308.1 PqqD family peptide modification chaperone [Nitrososphaeria archaeon]MDW7986832.1 PqqD family peptide modification chaperone [Nitrososphaerota archaeon]
MEEVKLKRKGELVKDEEGNLLLVNELNEAYRVDEIVAYIWSICDNRTFEEVAVDLASQGEVDVEEVKPPLQDLIAKLKSASLIE